MEALEAEGLWAGDFKSLGYLSFGLKGGTWILGEGYRQRRATTGLLLQVSLPGSKNSTG